MMLFLQTAVIRLQRSGLKLFARFEPDSLAGWNVCHFTRAGIATDAAFARFDHEDAESAQLDSLAALHRRLHALKQSFYRYFGFGLGDACLVSNLIHYIELYHLSPPITG